MASSDHPGSASSARAKASRLGLSRERILEAALHLLDRHGLDRFNMRSLAEDLGVGTMTLYGYFRSKEELIDAVIDHGVSGLEAADPGGPWKRRLRSLMVQIHAQLVEHPAIIELRLKRPLLSPGALELTERGMQILRDAGFDKGDAARIYRMLFVFTFGFAAFGPRADPQIEAQTLESLTALPKDRYPALHEAAAEAAQSMTHTPLFEVGLDLLLARLNPH